MYVVIIPLGGGRRVRRGSTGWGVGGGGRIIFESENLPLLDVALVEFMYLVVTRLPGESDRRRLRSLFLCSCDVFRELINSLAC